jgi:hypothetical protein
MHVQGAVWETHRDLGMYCVLIYANTCLHCSASSVILDLVNVSEYDASHAEVDLAIGKISLSLCMGDRQSKNLADVICCAVDVVPCSVRTRSNVCGCVCVCV